MSSVPMNATQREIQERLETPVRYRWDDPIRVEKREDLLFFAREAGVGSDWHEPDEQDLTALVYGQSFDNAGFWGEATYEYHTNEMHVVLYAMHYPMISVNLATLFAWATGYENELPLGPTTTTVREVPDPTEEIEDAEVVAEQVNAILWELES